MNRSNNIIYIIEVTIIIIMLFVFIVPVRMLFTTTVWFIMGMKDKVPLIFIFNISRNIGIQVTKLIGVRALCASLNDLVKLAMVIHTPDINKV